jgi:hypothetical protein
MKKILLLYFFLLYSSFNGAFAQAHSADQIYSKINNAIVTIYTFDANDKPIAQGSGVVLNQKGWIVTNYHVYAGAQKLVVKQKNKIVQYTNIIASDADKDILILKIANNSFPPIVIGNSDFLKIGQKIYTIGSPMGFENSITEGIISGLRSNEEKTKNFIQISAAISPGSSGGAVVNTKGELIAITTLTVTKGQNLNFAIPVNEVLNLYNKAGKKNDLSIKVSNENSNLYLIKVGDKYGFINSRGKMIIEPMFEDGRDFKEEVACVKMSGKWGIIDKSGKFLITTHLDEVTLFYEGLSRIKIDGKYGFMDKYGNIIIEPRFYDAWYFTEGLAQVSEEANKVGFIDKKGNYVITPQFYKAGIFKEGLAYALLGNGKYGFINKNGSVVIKPQFDEVVYFNEGYARVKYLEFVDNNFKRKWGFINKNGSIVIKPKFDYAFEFSEGLARIVVLKKWGFIDKTGNIIINPQFDYAGEFSEGLASIQIGQKEGYIDKTGNIIINPQFDYAGEFKNGLASVTVNNKWGYINHSGSWIWNPENEQSIQKSEPTNQGNGFKSLKIGDNQSKYSGSLTGISTESKGANTFRYTPLDDDLYNVFDIRIDKINLTFDNENRLVEITLIKSYSGSNSLQDAFADSKKVDPNLINLFGKQSGIIDINTSAELKLGRVWKTNKVTIKSYAEDYGMSNGTDLKITISDNDFIQQTIKSGF